MTGLLRLACDGHEAYYYPTGQPGTYVRVNGTWNHFQAALVTGLDDSHPLRSKMAEVPMPDRYLLAQHLLAVAAELAQTESVAP